MPFHNSNKRNIGWPGQDWREASKVSGICAQGAFLASSKWPKVGNSDLVVTLLVNNIDPKISDKKPKKCGENTAFKRDKKKR